MSHLYYCPRERDWRGIVKIHADILLAHRLRRPDGGAVFVVVVVA